MDNIVLTQTHIYKEVTMKVKHKVSGRQFEVSADYFNKYEDVLQVLEVVDEKPVKATTTKKKTKVITEETPVVLSEA